MTIDWLLKFECSWIMILSRTDFYLLLYVLVLSLFGLIPPLSSFLLPLFVSSSPSFTSTALSLSRFLS